MAGTTRAQLNVTWSANPTDPNYSFGQVWVLGYHTSKVPQLIASGKSGLAFTLDPTGEQVTVYVVAVSATGVSAALASAPRALVVLTS